MKYALLIIFYMLTSACELGNRASEMYAYRIVFKQAIYNDISIADYQRAMVEWQHVNTNCEFYASPFGHNQDIFFASSCMPSDFVQNPEFISSISHVSQSEFCISFLDIHRSDLIDPTNGEIYCEFSEE